MVTRPPSGPPHRIRGVPRCHCTVAEALWRGAHDEPTGTSRRNRICTLVVGSIGRLCRGLSTCALWRSTRSRLGSAGSTARAHKLREPGVAWSLTDRTAAYAACGAEAVQCRRVAAEWPRNVPRVAPEWQRRIAMHQRGALSRDATRMSTTTPMTSKTGGGEREMAPTPRRDERHVRPRAGPQSAGY